MTKQDFINNLIKAAKEIDVEIFWSKIYFPENLNIRVKYLIDRLNQKNLFYHSKEFKNSRYYEEEINPGPQFSYINLDEDLKKFKRVKTTKGNIQIWPRRIGGNLLSEKTLAGELLWKDESGNRFREELDGFYRLNKNKINRKTFDSEELFDIILSLWTIRKSQSGNKEAQDLLLKLFEQEFEKITKRFLVVKKAGLEGEDAKALGLLIFRVVAFGVDVKNYLEQLKTGDALNSSDKVLEMPVRKMIRKFLANLDLIPIRLLVIAASTQKEKIPDDLLDHYIGARLHLATVVMDPIEALIISGNMTSPSYEPRKHGKFTDWLFGNRRVSEKITGAFQRRLNDYYRAKTKLNEKGKRVAKQTELELLDNYNYQEQEHYSIASKRQTLSKEEVDNLINLISHYIKLNNLESRQKEILFEYALRKNIKVGFRQKKLITSTSLAKRFNCSAKTILRVINSFEKWSNNKL